MGAVSRFANHIQLVQGNITKARADAIVNAANQEMLGGGGVDGAIHSANSPIYGVDPDPEVLLASAYQSSLGLAMERGCQSVAQPALSCGVYGFPWDKAATVALEACGRVPFQNLSLILSIRC